MLLVSPYAKLLTPETLNDGKYLLRTIEAFGRVSHRTEEAQTENSWERFIPAVVLQHGDWSIVEHAIASVEFLVDRGMSHEIVRHRIASYTQESTRFVNYGKQDSVSFIKPVLSTESQKEQWDLAIKTSEVAYLNLLSLGIAPQIARSVLPNALATKLIVTANLRSWRNFLLLRTTKETHPQLREISLDLLKQFQERIPILFSDILGNEKQSISIAKGR